MPEPEDEFTDLRGRELERLDLSDARLRRVRLGGTYLRRAVMQGGEIRGSHISNTRLLGVEMYDVEITGDVQNLTINGVDVSDYVTRELDRRDPGRVLMRARTPEQFQHAWELLEERWFETVERAHGVDPALLHVQIDEEWSFIETLRHLVFATDAWFRRGVLGDPSPWHPLDLPWDEAPGWDGVPWDRDVQPTLVEVLAIRDDRVRGVRDFLATVTQEQLDATGPAVEVPGWPPPEPHVVGDCLRVILDEEWYHRQYAERDLDRVIAAALTTG